MDGPDEKPHLKCSEPFLEPCGRLDGGDTPPLLALPVGGPDVPKGGGSRVRDQPWTAGTHTGLTKRATRTEVEIETLVGVESCSFLT